MYFLILILVSVVYSILFFMRNQNLPGPIPIPIIGHLHYLILMIRSKDCLPLFRRFKDMYGDYFLVHVFHQQYVILSHSKHVEPLLSSMEFIKKGRNYGHLQSWLGDGLLTSTGERWKMHRKFLTPAFHFNILQNFLPVFLKNEKILIKKLKEKADRQPVNLFPIIALTALDNVTESIMGVPVNAQMQSESEYVKSIETICYLVSKKMRIPILGPNFIYNLTPYKKMEDRALKVLHDQSLQVIEKRREELKNKNTEQTECNDRGVEVIYLTETDDLKGKQILYLRNINTISLSNVCAYGSLITVLGIKNKHAFLDLLLLSELNGDKINIQHIREEVDTFMFEGHDTTTSAICFGLYCISKSEDIQEKILDEQKRISGDNLARNPTYTELQQMKYLEMVIKESLRLYPSVPLIERTITKDCQLSGLPIKKGASVIVNIFEIQRHADLFEDPLVFRPERFDSTSNNTFCWLAFSAGPRNCIGQKFAMMEMKVIISAIVKNFKLHPVDEEPVLCADLILRSENGVKVSLSKRE